jgi:hypothetical protein
MFTIEFVAVHGWDDPGLVERRVCTFGSFADAERTARSQLAGVRAMHPDTPPDGFQILDGDGSVLLRSWEVSPDRAGLTAPEPA